MTSPTNVRISRREGFNAAHQLQDASLSEDENRHLYGKCVNLHGHNYVLEVVVSGAIDPSTGYVMDLKRLSDLLTAEIIQHVDHRNLNTDVAWLHGQIPTAENLALAPNVDIAHKGLMNSPGHRANILSPSFGRVGIGVIDGGGYGKMFAQEFAD